VFDGDRKVERGGSLRMWVEYKRVGFENVCFAVVINTF
jgi:hypothetical protein